MPDTKKANPAGSAFSEDTIFGLFARAQPRRLAQVSISLLLTLLCLRCQGFGGQVTNGFPNLSRLTAQIQAPSPGKAGSRPRQTDTIKAVPLRMRGGPLVT